MQKQDQQKQTSDKLFELLNQSNINNLDIHLKYNNLQEKYNEQAKKINDLNLDIQNIKQKNIDYTKKLIKFFNTAHQNGQLTELQKLKKKYVQIIENLYI